MLGSRLNRLRTRMRYTRYKRPPPPKTTLAAATMLVMGVVSLRIAIRISPLYAKSYRGDAVSPSTYPYSHNCASSARVAACGMAGIGVTGTLAHVERRQESWRSAYPPWGNT